MNLSRLQKNFESLAAEDPLWTVLSDNSKKGGKWDPEEFYQSGEDTIHALEEQLAHHGIRMRGDTALDFGCGVGRLTFPLSRRFKNAIGVDISESMISEAKKNAGRGDTCKFVLNTESTLAFLENETLDFAYSNIVFQHIQPRYSKRYFREIARALKPGGTFAFQLPSHFTSGSLLRKRLGYQLKSISQSLGLGKAYFEMNAIPREKLIRFFESSTDLKLITLWDYPAAGPNWQSYLYVFQKR
ncbi:class I SAM-dependent methyltransferase [Pelagicoccus mobilis]|uniref:Methyltransferase domain-containing protein n=1 Tax=Pelagicoccus mobilis TaxID=415221 RepID=A0A934VPL3_9BACT|nr:class I SAM-dependent methyltransferase [Pelagicoccus mobilis]MBK1875648.1 methyltransferase domain-containing protein [Pelagicoccus mobilis]